MKFSGRVIHGDGIGRQLGYPTANLDIAKASLPLASGVYACRVRVEDKTYDGSFVVRENPWKVEVHIIGYDGGNLYGRSIEGDVIEKISELENFFSRESLIEKIRSDVEKVKIFLKN
ncbi:MAG: riboflavin kinase [Patescibacteria group bacterium]